MAGHARFVARTVLVDHRGLDSAYRDLQRIMVSNGLIRKLRLGKTYEKHKWKRERLEHEACKRIYGREMHKKINFLEKRHEPLSDMPLW